MARILGLTSFYDEPKTNITRSLEALHAIGCEHVAAVDGAYAALKGGKPTSPSWQRRHLRRECERLGMELALFEPVTTWAGNEIEKRTFLFRFAEQSFTATRGDWYFVMDADQDIERATDLRPWLATIDGDVVETLFVEHDAGYQGDRRRLLRNMFRCLPGIHVEGTHYTYVDQDGRVLWGVGAIPGAGIAPIIVHNLSDERGHTRRNARRRYYHDRNTAKLEQDNVACDKCGTTDNVRLVNATYDIVTLPDGSTQLAHTQQFPRCQRHSVPVRYRNAMKLVDLGLNPGRLRQYGIGDTMHFTPGPTEGPDPHWK